MQTLEASAEADIRALLEQYVGAIRSGDVDAIVAHYTPDIVAFDAILQLQFKGVADYRRHWQTCLGFTQGPMRFEIHQLTVVAAEQVAFAYFLTHCGGTDQNGQEHTGWSRGSMGLRREDGRWRIAHEHYSMPFDPESGQMLAQLTP